MELMNIVSFGGKRQWLALGCLAAGFATVLALDLNAWVLVAMSVLFVGYVCRSFSAFFISEHNYSGGRIVAYLLPVGIAVIQTLVCLGVVWLIVWTSRGLYQH